ncbi:Lrp/AsnC family transcriptional regulator [Paracrocinitomix mangrovi]|uniref:Lrp/AsnC family transcriptional regulator n=1 Tax=Paracrocinitomix mangrovi TaxID=2862509 RepID=UPI001C8D6C2F|nr:Lrp/AsnC family transcriptional regulator [Paracrocinitomix mangrovi]UKN01403.1 Lrp/AsnC family transcriptional regulator [Paracrocinitomix mangrovi]
MKIDETDLRILDFLQKDANLTAKELSAKLSLSSTPIYERIKKLEKNGIIKKYVALLDPEKLDKQLMVFINITIKEHQQSKRARFLEKVLGLEEVVELYHTSGTYDFMAKVRFDNIKKYRDFLVNKIAPIENIADIDSQIVLDEIKYTTEVNLTDYMSNR